MLLLLRLSGLLPQPANCGFDKWLMLNWLLIFVCIVVIYLLRLLMGFFIDYRSIIEQAFEAFAIIDNNCILLIHISHLGVVLISRKSCFAFWLQRWWLVGLLLFPGTQWLCKTTKSCSASLQSMWGLRRAPLVFMQLRIPDRGSLWFRAINRLELVASILALALVLRRISMRYHGYNSLMTLAL